MFEGQKGNLALWSECRFIDPAFTKTFTRRGGFSGRSINATYVIMRATEVFGPIGIGWGWNIIDDRYADGHEILSSDGTVLGRESVHVVRIKLWYMWNGQRGEIEHFGQTMFVAQQKKPIYENGKKVGEENSLSTDEEHAKKSLTDAITKALSCLGIAAEIHLGKWDDNKYIGEMQIEARERAAPANGGRQIVPAQRPVAAVVPIHADPVGLNATDPDTDSDIAQTIKEIKIEITGKNTFEDIKKAVAKGYSLARMIGDEKLHNEFKEYATNHFASVTATKEGYEK